MARRHTEGQEKVKKDKKHLFSQAVTSPVQSSWVWLHNYPSIKCANAVIPPLS